MNSDLEKRLDEIRAELKRIAAIEGHDPQSCTDLKLAVQTLAEVVRTRAQRWEELQKE